jgi:hypothetical protein
MILRIAAMASFRLCAVVAFAQTAPIQLSNADIVKMLKAQVDEKIVKAVIENSDGKMLDASPTAIQALKTAGGSKAVLDAVTAQAAKAKNRPLTATMAKKGRPHPTKVGHATETIKRLTDPKQAIRTAGEIESLQPETCSDNLENVDDCHDNFKAGCTHSEHPNYDAYLDYLKNATPDPGSTVSSGVNGGSVIDASFLAQLENNTPDTLTAHNHAQHAADLADMGEGQIVTVVGTLYYAIHGGAESVNCQLSGDESLVDFHIGIGFADFPLGADALDQLRGGTSVDKLGKADQAALQQNSFVVEMTPFYREHFKPLWTLSKVQSVTGRQVKVTGQLMIDNFHHKPQDDCGLADASAKCWRLSVWEIHPVSGFQVCSTSHCDASSDHWVSLDDM